MIDIAKLNIFPFKTKEIRVPNVPSKQIYSVIFYPENVSFFNVYNALKIRRTDIRTSTVFPNTYPRLVINAKTLKAYRDLGLMPIRSVGNKTKNHFIDTTLFFNKIESTLRFQSYKAAIPTAKVKEYLRLIDGSIKNTKKVFLYCIDLNAKISNNIFFRRIYPMIQLYREEGKFPFDYFLVCLLRNGIPTYTMLVNPNKEVQFQRMFQFLKNIRSVDEDEVEGDKDEIAAKRVVNNIDMRPLIDPNDVREVQDGYEVPVDAIQANVDLEKSILRGAIASYVKYKPELRNTLVNKTVDPVTMLNIATSAILFSITGDLHATEQAMSAVKPEQMNDFFEKVRKELMGDVVTRSPAQNNSRDTQAKHIDIAGINDNKDPSHLLNKRQKDFKNSFEKDLRNSFDILSKKPDFPLKIDSIKMTPILPVKGDLEPTYEDMYTITLSDEKGRKHDVEIRVPTLMDDGSFMHKGRKKYLVYQIILDPIFFLKKWIVKLETLYAALAIESKQMKAKQYLACYVAGYKLPLMAFMGLYLGFHETSKMFGFKYKIVADKPTKGTNYLNLADKTYLTLEYNTEHARQLLMSMKEIPFEITSQNLLEKKTFEEAIIKIVGNRNSLYIINEVIDNIMEPVSVQVLKTKMLPFTLSKCIIYMCEEVVTGRFDARNDLSKQRLRSSEVFNHQVIKQILKSYNTYRLQRVSGDKVAEYKCETDKLVKDIMNSKLVRELENINPLEELSCLTRTTPIGIGGIPDKHSMTEASRGTHASYYGNLDPMDTPEGDTIGMINQLTVNAAVTNARGSFVNKPDIDEKSGVLSTSSVFVPFVNCDDGNRVQLSCSQSRQSVPIMGNEPAICQTGYESIMTHMLSDSYIKKTQAGGIVHEVSNDYIIVKMNNGRLERHSLEPVKLLSGQGQSAVNTFTPIVKIGQKVKQQQILAEGKHIINGTISTGVNLLTAIMGWKGYQIEDGYVVSDAIIDKKIASNHFFEKEIIVKKGDKILFIAQEGQDTKKGEPLLRRTSSDLEELIGIEESEEEADEMISGGQIILKSPGGKIISLEIYPNIGISNYPILKEPYEKFKQKYEKSKGEMPKKFLKFVDYEKTAISGIIIRFKLEDEFPAEQGDKLANRHGNKGVITYIEKAENMPRTPWGDRVEIIFNPLSIINRMNPGQLYEFYISTISKFAAKQLVAWGTKKTQKAMTYLATIYANLDNTKNKKYSAQVMKFYRTMPDSVWAKYIYELQAKDFFMPMVVPQFQTPTREQIKKVMDYVGLKNGYKLRLPEYNRSTIRDVATGWMYFNKLEQQATIKMGARSTAMYQGKTMQPTQGKRRDGGQRAGEADVNAILSHGAINVLKEIMGPLSDDQRTKSQIIAEIIQTGSAAYREPQTSPTRDLLQVYMTSLGLEI